MLLDILIDEASVTALCMVLATLYPAWLLVFQAFSIIDFTGQWILYYFSARYKNGDFRTQDNKILSIYFNHTVAGDMWVYGNHTFLISLYLAYYNAGPALILFGYDVSIWTALACVAAPFSISRLLIMLGLLVHQMYYLGRLDQEKADLVAKQRDDDIRVAKERNDIVRAAKERNGVLQVAEERNCVFRVAEKRNGVYRAAEERNGVYRAAEERNGMVFCGLLSSGRELKKKLGEF